MTAAATEMTTRQRLLESLRFGNPDKIPLTPGGGRKSTRERWYSEGLPRDVKNITEYAYRQAGGTQNWPTGGPGFSANERMIPQFEEKVIEKKESSLIVQDWKGNICEISDEFDVSYLREAIDFVTRRWVKCPVESREDWEDMMKRYDASDPARYPEDPAECGEQLKDRNHWVGLYFSGPFWQMREWAGFEGLCFMMKDDPAFVHEMADFWKEHVAGLLRNALKHFTPDEVHLSEDMAYKSFSMISPNMAREFLMPCYECWGEIIHGAGIPVYAMDSDGYIGDLIPIWIEAGINACDPIEVAAHNDIVDFRKRFGKDMAYRGGVDKRAIAKGGKVIEDEINRIRPVVEGGGFVPGCDHGVPSDVSWKDFVYYIKLLAQMTGWL